MNKHQQGFERFRHSVAAPAAFTFLILGLAMMTLKPILGVLFAGVIILCYKLGSQEDNGMG